MIIIPWEKSKEYFATATNVVLRQLVPQNINTRNAELSPSPHLIIC